MQAIRTAYTALLLTALTLSPASLRAQTVADIEAEHARGMQLRAESRNAEALEVFQIGRAHV